MSIYMMTPSIAALYEGEMTTYSNWLSYREPDKDGGVPEGMGKDDGEEAVGKEAV